MRGGGTARLQELERPPSFSPSEDDESADEPEEGPDEVPTPEEPDPEELGGSEVQLDSWTIRELLRARRPRLAEAALIALDASLEAEFPWSEWGTPDVALCWPSFCSL